MDLAIESKGYGWKIYPYVSIYNTTHKQGGNKIFWFRFWRRGKSTMGWKVNNRGVLQHNNYS
jgi:hypothetical protein